MDDMNCDCAVNSKYFRGFKRDLAAYMITVPVYTVKSKETFVRIVFADNDYPVGSRDLDILSLWFKLTDSTAITKTTETEASYLVLAYGYKMADLKEYLDEMGATYDIYEYRVDGNVKWTEDLHEEEN